MDRGHDHLDHREYEDLLAAAALGALTPEEHALLAQHLESCASCRSTLGDLLMVTDALPMQVEEQSPSPALRQRLREQVEPESIAALTASDTPDPAPISPFPPPGQHQRRESGLPRSAWAMLVAAMLVLALLAGIAVDRWVLPDPAEDVETIALSYPGSLSLNDASLTWSPDRDLLQFSVADLPALPEGMVYQVWLFQGETPLPSGTINPDTGEYVIPMDRGEYATFAITVEPGPIGSPAPTSEVVVLASLDEIA